jgi:hypothetical protein
MKKFIILCSPLLFLVGVALYSQINTERQHKLVGRWERLTSCGKVYFSFKLDGNYVMEFTPTCGPNGQAATIWRGKYFVSLNRIHLYNARMYAGYAGDLQQEIKENNGKYIIPVVKWEQNTITIYDDYEKRNATWLRRK